MTTNHNVSPSSEDSSRFHPNTSGQVWAVIAAAGLGERFISQDLPCPERSHPRDKLLASLGGQPVLARTLATLLSTPALDGAVVVAHPGNLAAYQQVLSTNCYQQNKPYHLISGGRSRRESVLLGLQALPPNVAIVVIHDAARPLVNPVLVEQGIQRIRQGEAALIMALPIHDTIKKAAHKQATHKKTAQKAQPHIECTLDRAHLWRAQTPQFFQKDLILKAHAQIPQEIPITDDAQLVELTGLAPVGLLQGEARNLKITTPEDLAIAEALLQIHTPCY